jgi:hypothetical protein
MSALSAQAGAGYSFNVHIGLAIVSIEAGVGEETASKIADALNYPYIRTHISYGLCPYDAPFDEPDIDAFTQTEGVGGGDAATAHRDRLDQAQPVAPHEYTAAFDRPK